MAKKTTPNEDEARNAEDIIAAFDLLSDEDKEISPDKELVEMLRIMIANEDKKPGDFFDKMDSGI